MIYVCRLDDSLFRHIGKQQITDLILISNETSIETAQPEYTQNVYAIILGFFKNLKQLSILSSSVNDYPPLSLYTLSTMTFSSWTLIKLCINVSDFDDCLKLLDGRLKQLTTFIVQINYIKDQISTSGNMVSLCDVSFLLLSCI